MIKWLKWLVLGLVVGGLALSLSIKTYVASLNRQEVQIAVLNNPTSIIAPKAGQLRVFYGLDPNNKRKIILNNSTVLEVMNPEDMKDTGLVVNAGESVSVAVFEGPNYGDQSYGWVTPNADDTCGQGNIARKSIAAQLAKVIGYGEEIISIQCWSDWEPEEDPTLDFEDFLLIFSYVPSSGRPDYCVSASADKATLNPGETLTLSSQSNLAVNGFFYAVYNADNNPSGNSPYIVCIGTRTDAQCPNGGKPFIISDPNNKTDGTGLRNNGSAQISFDNLFVTDKTTGEQVKNIQFNAYFSLNGGQWSWPKLNCVAYTKMGTISSPPPPPGESPPSDESPPLEGDLAGFVINKFLDANNNGVREVGEETTNRAWEFEYQINDGEKQSYLVEPGETSGEVIYVNKGEKVKVTEIGQEGWLNTTGAELTKTLTQAKLYNFYFGNYPVGGIGGASPGPATFPPTQPDTGTPTWLTAGALGLGAVLLMVKWLWL
ncbi:MAG: hypothetical protein U0946_05720 [Patescibacteria group bacterium]|nr:hypothetical protein [Patescibacteria group bacterium]